MNRVGLALTAAWLAVVGGAFLLGSPQDALSPSVLAPILRGGVLALLAWGGCLGMGGHLSRWFLPGPEQEDPTLVRPLVLGLGAWGLLSLACATVFGVGVPWAWAMLVPGVLSWVRPPRVALPQVGPMGWVVATALLGTLLLSASAPVLDTDEMYYHLALPRQVLLEGALVGGPLDPNGSRPLALHLPYTWLLALGGPSAPRIFHGFLLIHLVAAVHLRARQVGSLAGALAPLLLLGSASFLFDLGLAHADVPAALAAWAAFDALERRVSPSLVALLCGVALALKYTAVVAVAPVLLLLAIQGVRGPRTPRSLLVPPLLFLVPLAPWWVRNLLEGLHPLFPFTGWDGDGALPFHFLEKYGAGRSALDLALLPWNLFMGAEWRSFRFLGRLNPAFLALVPVAAWAAWKDPRPRWALAVTLLGFLAWGAGPHLVRYLLPLLPVAALGLASGLEPLPRALRLSVMGVWLAGLPANLAPVARDLAVRMPASLGWTTATPVPAPEGMAAVQWLNRHTPPDARVALLFSWQGYALERRWTLGSVEDHVPSRHLVARCGMDLVECLKAEGVGWVLMERVVFLRRSYPFLEPQAFDALFRQPVDQALQALEQGAELVFEEGRTGVWRLP